MSASSTGNIKDMLIECISKDVKELQQTHSDVDTANNLVANSDEVAKQLCDHLDHILLHGLKDIEKGYWDFVCYFTRMDAIKMIKKLTQVTTDLGKGRAWLNLSLNEQATESYLRMFLEYQDQVAVYYTPEAFLSDVERLLLLQTLVTGLDFIYFDLSIDTPYFDYSASEPSLNSGIQDLLSYTIAVEPQFIAKVDQQKPKNPMTGLLYSQYTTSDKHEGYHMKQPTSGTTPLSQSTKLGSVSPEDISTEHPLLLGRQNSEPVAKKSSRQQKGHLLEHVGPASLPARGPDAVYNVSATLAPQDDGEIEVTSVKKWKAKKKKHKKKKRMVADSDKTSADHDSTSEQVMEDDAILNQETGDHQTADSGGPTLQQVEKSDYIMDSQSTSTTAPVHSSPPESSVSRNLTKPPSPRKSSPEVLSSIENTTSGGLTPATGPVQDRHSSRDDYNVKKSSLSGTPLDHSSMSQHSHTQAHRSTAKSHHSSSADPSSSEISHRKQSQEPNYDSSATQNKPSSPQEESWVKQLFVAREKASQVGDQQKKQLDESERRQFASGSAKFTTLVEDPTSDGGKDRGAVSHKAVLLPVDGPTIPDVKELLKSKEVTKAEMKAVEMNVDQNTRLIFSLEIFLDSDEEMSKLIQASSPDERGNWQMAFVLITNQTVYLLRKDGADHDGLDYSREIAIPLQKLSYLMIGLNWQSLVIAHDGSQLVVILTGNEAVTRTILETINEVHLEYNQCLLPLNRGDDMRSKALMREVARVDPQNNYLMLLYSLVNWEQLKGELPPLLMPIENDEKNGVLYYKAVMLGMTYWKQGYFVIRKGSLYMYTSESDKMPKAQYPLQAKTCGGCKRVAGERPHSFMVVFSGSPDLTLSASTEEEMLDWTQAFCEAVVGKKLTPNQMTACISCGVLITSNKVCIMKEEWLNGVVSETLVTSCNIDDITDVDVDPLLPLYCILSYLPSERSDAESISWLICFESTHELSKFSIKLAEEWKKTFQIDINFSEVKDELWKQRAYKAVDLMQASRHRNDSITRGRGIPLMI